MYKWLCIFLLFIISACSFNSKYVEKIFFEMGTVISITMDEKKYKYISDIIEYMNNLADTIKKDEYNLSNAKPETDVKISNHTMYLYKEALNYYKISNKLYDPTAYTISSLYGFPEGKDYKIPAVDDLKYAKQNAGFQYVSAGDETLKKSTNLKIDFSANSKGYIVDKTVNYMRKKGIKNFIVNAGGDVYCSGKKNKYQFKVYIEDPDRKNKGILSIIRLENKAVATSGDAERFFYDVNGNKITHIFSGITFEPVDNYKSISVIADTTEKADGFATLYYLLSVDEISKLCKQMNTPVLIYTTDKQKIKLCNWENYEEK